MIRAAEVRSSLESVLLGQAGAATGSFRHVVSDSQRVRPGDLFVALRGEHHDGHDFVADALARGARGLLVQQPPAKLPEDVVVYEVRDTLDALQRLAAGRRRQFDVRVIAITGSVGKSTTKEITASLLSHRFKVLKNEANYNNEIGLPLTLLGLTRRHDLAVLEMGMYALGEIRLLCDIARPQVGVVTNVGPSHLERLGSIEAIAAAKAELAEALPSDGCAIFNGDDPIVRKMAKKTQAKAILYGTSAGCQVRGTELESKGLRGFSFTLEYEGTKARAETRLPGRHLLHNALAAAAVGLEEGMSLKEVTEALAQAQARLHLHFHVHKGRNGCKILDDTYNASPVSTLAALALLSDMPGRRIAVLGDMRELGAATEEGHRVVGREAARVAQIIHTVGELGCLIGKEAQEAGHPAVRMWESKEEMASALAPDLRRGDVVLLKASRALELEKILPELKD
jgi:UDP-N-acetylmuramoyl-tripeptide--D-alanyl-D-alanine ligase